MVKKLFKHEYLSYVRVMSIVYVILLTMAAANRIIQLFEADTVAYKIVSVFSFITYGVSVAAAFGFSFVLGILRFYRNLFTAEGYLTFTLPVTPSQHICVKAIAAVSMNILTFVVVLLSGCIVTAGEVLKELWLAADYLLKNLYELVGSHMITVGLEYVLLLLLACFSGVGLYYTFIAIGQLFKKNRILAAVGAYFAYYVLTQIVTTVITIVFTVLGETGALEPVALWIMEHFAASVHIGMWIGIVLTALFTAVEFFIVKRIITRKLNLE
ncbi:MAG: hypothetical protein IJO72_06000 [Oscillospiraceae bacterium]|nr:hypothetical protein [Oscillospiraceae bacterium]MBQ9930312.1 hypothetical protein [Oscillospiraceae bacterium]